MDGNGNGGLSGTDALALMSGNGWGNNAVPFMMGMNGGFGGFGGDAIWLIALLALAGGGFGFGGNQFGYQPQYATQDFVQNGFNFNNLLDGNRDILNAIQRDTYDTITAIKDGNAATIREFGNVETGLATLSAQNQQCCCDILRAIDGVNYNGAMNTASINANNTANTQKILDAIQQNRIDDMQNQINNLQLQNALQGVVRYPNGYTYNAGASPFCNSGCGCCGNM